MQSLKQIFFCTTFAILLQYFIMHTWKTVQILQDDMTSAEFGRFPCHITPPNTWKTFQMTKVW